MRKNEEFVRPKGSLTPILVVIAFLYVLGIGAWVIITRPILTDSHIHVLGQLFAFCAAYQVWYWRGSAEVTYKSKSPGSSFILKLGGAAAIYGITLWWWEGPMSPVVPTSSVRQETSSFADTFERKLAELQAALLKVSPNARSTAGFQSAVNEAIGQAKAEIEGFRSSHKLTEAENRTLDNLIQRMPAVIQILSTDSPPQPPEQSEQIVTNNFINSTILSQTVTNVASNAANTYPNTVRTNIVTGASGDPATASQGGEANTVVTVPVANLPVNAANPIYQSAPSPSVLPLAVSNALTANLDSWVSRYPDGFTVQFQMQIFGPYNAPSGKSYSFINIPSRPEMSIGQYGGGLVFLPTLSYLDRKFSKPVHLRYDGRVQNNGQLMRSIRQWHILPVASYIESVRGLVGQPPVLVVGNGSDENWQPGLLDSIRPYFYQLDQYFPNGFYMVTADGKELNIFKDVDPNNTATWSSTSVTKQQSGWQVTFPQDVLGGRAVQTLVVPYPNQLGTIIIEGDHATNTVGVIVYQIQSGPVFFMGIRNN